MRVLRRAWKALMYKWKKTLLMSLVYAVLCSVLIIVMMLNVAAGQQIRDTQMAIGNAVYIRKQRTVDLGKRNNLAPFTQTEKEILTGDGRVARYNLLVKEQGNLLNAQPYYTDQKRYEEYIQRIEESGIDKEILDNATFVGVTDSRYSVFFTGVGFRLTAGKALTKEDGKKKVVLVSQALADQNGWKVGDSIDLSTGKDQGFSKPTEFQAVIKGIYSPSENSFAEEEYKLDRIVEHYLFFPTETLQELDPVMYQTYMIYAYMAEPQMASGYIEDMQERLDAGAVDVTSEGMPQTKLHFSSDNTWNEIVSIPLKEIHNVTNVALMLTLAGVLTVILLVSAGELRESRKEFGIWLACGESRKRILLQTLLQKLIPLTLGIVLALTVSTLSADQVSERIVGNTASGINEEMAWDRENTQFWEQYYEIEDELRSGNYNFYYLSDHVDLYQNRQTIIVVLLGGYLLFVGVLAIQIGSALRRKPSELLGREE